MSVDAAHDGNEGLHFVGQKGDGAGDVQKLFVESVALFVGQVAPVQLFFFQLLEVDVFQICATE